MIEVSAGKLAYRAALCYNDATKMVVAWSAGNTAKPRYKIGACTMDDSIPSASGIYKITCISNKRIYIGSATNLRKRKQEHWNGLRANRRHNLHIQRTWNKYGEDAFTFEVLELVLPMSLTAREQYWLNTLHPTFNAAPIAGSSLGIKHSPESVEHNRQAQLGRKASPEAKAKMSATRLGKKRPPMSLEQREKLRQSALGRKLSPETCEKMSQSRKGKPLYSRRGVKLSNERREQMRQNARKREREKGRFV